LGAPRRVVGARQYKAVTGCSWFWSPRGVGCGHGAPPGITLLQRPKLQPQ